ncbi:MAG: hypothetical protein JSU86_05120 [Phycisphaerales bacterium]|nr:MAG: hypothetical protein JSU86_05120 [Phycisphaerales bacterium]
MNATMKTTTAGILTLIFSQSLAGVSFANGGPFVIKYPGGDPAAKGILARLDPNLKPAREERLRVIKEDLQISFASDGHRLHDTSRPPLVSVSAAYTIENSLDEEIEVDFGFPILRGIYMNPRSMAPRPAVHVRFNGKQSLRTTIISNSAIYGIIRQRAREVIENGIAADPSLEGLVAAVRAGGTIRGRTLNVSNATIGANASLARAVSQDRLLAEPATPVAGPWEGDVEVARTALAAYLTGQMGWSARNAALMVELASLDIGDFQPSSALQTAHHWWLGNGLIARNLGPLKAIGEQKATQLFSQLAGCFDPAAGSAYESIFTAWGGDVRERSVDLTTGEVRPREFSIDAVKAAGGKPRDYNFPPSDPTLYARVDYLDPNANISEAQKASCRSILKNLPVIFTYAPMNLLHYRAIFPAESISTLVVSYKQYAYQDTRTPQTFQVAYVVHPASLWEHFGPINLVVAVPEGVAFRASVPSQKTGIRQLALLKPSRSGGGQQYALFGTHQATLNDKAGELFLAVDAGAWKRAIEQKVRESQRQRHVER